MIARDLGIVFLAAVTAAVAVWRVQALVAGPDLPPPMGGRSVVRSQVDVPLHPEDRATERWARTLFSPSGAGQRAGSDVMSERADGAATSQARLPRLVGIIIQGADRIAIMEVGGKIRRVRENSEVNKWTLVRVDARSILMRSSDETRTVMLDQARTNRR